MCWAMASRRGGRRSTANNARVAGGQPRGHQCVRAEARARAPRLGAVERVTASPVAAGVHHRVGGLRRPHTPQLIRLRFRSVEFSQDRDSVGVRLGEPARDDVLFGQGGQPKPPLRRGTATRQRQLQRARCEPLP